MCFHRVLGKLGHWGDVTHVHGSEPGQGGKEPPLATVSCPLLFKCHHHSQHVIHSQKHHGHHPCWLYYYRRQTHPTFRLLLRRHALKALTQEGGAFFTSFPKSYNAENPKEVTREEKLRLRTRKNQHTHTDTVITVLFLYHENKVIFFLLFVFLNFLNFLQLSCTVLIIH